MNRHPRGRVDLWQPLDLIVLMWLRCVVVQPVQDGVGRSRLSRSAAFASRAPTFSLG